VILTKVELGWGLGEIKRFISYHIMTPVNDLLGDMERSGEFIKMTTPSLEAAPCPGCLCAPVILWRTTQTDKFASFQPLPTIIPAHMIKGLDRVRTDKAQLDAKGNEAFSQVFRLLRLIKTKVGWKCKILIHTVAPASSSTSASECW
jgi:hypothetical protein